MEDVVNDNPLFGGAYAGKRVLVTGHTGFKGAWLTSWLLDLGAEVTGWSDRVPTQPALFVQARLAPRIEDFRGDVRDAAGFAAALLKARPDYVFHMAAQAIVAEAYRDPLGTLSTNVMGTAVVLEALRAVDWPCAAVLITSDKAYENLEQPWGYREIDRLGGKDVYSASKGAAELVFHAYRHAFLGGDGQVRMATARAGNVIGGGDWAPDRIVADCIRAWQGNARVEIRSPDATRPWQHVLEPLSGYLTLAARLAEGADLQGESFNFGPRAEQNRRVVGLLEDLASVWGFAHPMDSYRIAGDVPFHEAGLLKLNCDKALLALRWEPTLDYEECVALTGGWYREVMRDGRDAVATTGAHIRRYEALARERGAVWAA